MTDLEYACAWRMGTDGQPDRRELRLELPMRLNNPLNGSHGHWATRAKVRRHQRQTIGLTMRALLTAEGIKLPVSVTVTRIAPRPLDRWDGLGASCKAVIDGIADALGCRDDDKRITWVVEQRKGKPRQYGVEILVTQAGAPR